MELSAERQASLLAYCKLTDQADDPEVQTLIPLFYADAVGYMSGAGVALPPEDDDRRAQYDLLVNAMVLDSWDHRDMVSDRPVTANPAFRQRINQLKLTEPVSAGDPVSDSDTSKGE